MLLIIMKMGCYVMGLLMKQTKSLSTRRHSEKSSLFGSRGLRYYISSDTATGTYPATGSEVYKTRSDSGRVYTSQAYKNLASLSHFSSKKRHAQSDRSVHTVNSYKNSVELLRSLHKEHEPEINWSALKDAPPPFDLSEKGPREIRAEKLLENYSPSLSDKIFSRTDAKMRELKNNIARAKKEDMIDYHVWENISALADGISKKDAECMLLVIENMYPFDDLLELGVDITVGADSTGCVEVEVNANTGKIVPHQVLTLGQGDKVNKMEMDRAS